MIRTKSSFRSRITVGQAFVNITFSEPPIECRPKPPIRFQKITPDQQNMQKDVSFEQSLGFCSKIKLRITSF